MNDKNTGGFVAIACIFLFFLGFCGGYALAAVDEDLRKEQWRRNIYRRQEAARQQYLEDLKMYGLTR